MAPDRGAAFAAALLAALLLAPSPAPAGVSANPHDFMADQSQCGRCHAESPVRPGGSFVRDIVSLCEDCHSQGYRMSHPVDVRPARAPVKDLPLDADGTMTCVTCHDPHASPYDDSPRVSSGLVQSLRQILSGEGYRTYFLRVSNVDGRVCFACHAREDLARDLHEPQTGPGREYAGSDVCGECHPEIHAMWRKTSHARTLQDARQKPEALLARFSGEENFRPEEVVFAVGTHYTRRFVVNRGGELVVARGVWMIGEDRWGRSYWKEQPWRELCAGCHLTGYDPFRGTLAEAGVGCEMCHGPGAKHARSRDPKDIVNPAALGDNGRDTICASCHTHGHDRTGQFRYPVGYTPGQDLSLYYRGLTARTGQDPETFHGDESAEDRLRSYRYWADNFFRHNRFACKLCKNFLPETGGPSEERASVPAHHCMECHELSSLEGREHQFGRGKDVQCSGCHKPAAARDGRPSIHDHKFIFPAP